MVRGLTTAIKYRFDAVPIESVSACNLTIKQGNLILKKRLSDAVTDGDMLVWKLTQQETLAFAVGHATSSIKWRSGDTVGGSNITELAVEETQDEEIL